MTYRPIESPSQPITVQPPQESPPYPPVPAHDELTEEERVEYEKGIITWSKVKNWRFWIRKEWIWYYLVFVLIVVVVALMAFFHHSVSPLLLLGERGLMADHQLVDALRSEVTAIEVWVAYTRRYTLCAFFPPTVWE
jgi:hypothetical protein